MACNLKEAKAALDKILLEVTGTEQECSRLRKELSAAKAKIAELEEQIERMRRR